MGLGLFIKIFGIFANQLTVSKLIYPINLIIFYFKNLIKKKEVSRVNFTGLFFEKNLLNYK